MEQTDRWYLHISFARATDDTQHNTPATLITEPLPLHCAVLRQELAIAQLQLTNCGIGASNSMHLLPPQSTSTSSPLCSSLRSEKVVLFNSSLHSHAPIVYENTTEQEQDTADSTHKLLPNRHLGNPLDFATGMDPVLPNNDSQNWHLQEDASRLTLRTTLAATGMDPVLSSYTTNPPQNKKWE